MSMLESNNREVVCTTVPSQCYSDLYLMENTNQVKEVQKGKLAI